MAGLRIWPSVRVVLHQSSLPPTDQTVDEKKWHPPSSSPSTLPFLTSPTAVHKRFLFFFFTFLSPIFIFFLSLSYPWPIFIWEPIFLMSFTSSPLPIVSSLHAVPPWQVAHTVSGTSAGFLRAKIMDTCYAYNPLLCKQYILEWENERGDKRKGKYMITRTKRKYFIWVNHCLLSSARQPISPRPLT